MKNQNAGFWVIPPMVNGQLRLPCGQIYTMPWRKKEIGKRREALVKKWVGCTKGKIRQVSSSIRKAERGAASL